MNSIETSWLTGVIADLPSPFDANDAIDIGVFENLCAQQIAAGATALLLGETAGEMATLTMAEHDTLVRTAVKVSRGRVKIIAGAGSNGTGQAIALTRRAEAAGADAVMSVVPYYNKPTQSGIEAHFDAIASATRLPVVIHDNPTCCARGLDDETLMRLCDNPRIVGLRDSSGDAMRPLRLHPHVPPGFRMVAGDDATALTYLAHGGDGFVSTVANILPALPFAMFRAFSRGDVARAATLMDRMAPLRDAFATDGSVASLKYALGLRGLCSPRVRLPMVPLMSDQKAAVTEATAAALRGTP
ncbi:4-hydroxy-tetrahydrodipicolinate synthase [Rhodopseudomonas telluris]|uniref:4-hydroxy-tetrahydrodipicolinate synthase n=1 Tax=Rhodopseudomonas telluris TaxID=644215 RepID=A0ABV6EUQ1_9BRAD